MTKRLLVPTAVLLIILLTTLLYYARAIKRDEVLEGPVRETAMRGGTSSNILLSKETASVPITYAAHSTEPSRAPTSDYLTDAGGLKYELLNPATFISRRVFTVPFLVEGRQVAVVVKPGKNGAAKVLVCSPPNKDGTCRNRASATLISGAKPTKERITVIDAGITATPDHGAQAAIMYKAGLELWVVLLQPGGRYGFKSAAVCQPNG